MFPFQYKGKIYNTCVNEASGSKTWCSTEVNEANIHIQGSWGVCDPRLCPKQISKPVPATPVERAAPLGIDYYTGEGGEGADDDGTFEDIFYSRVTDDYGSTDDSFDDFEIDDKETDDYTGDGYDYVGDDFDTQVLDSYCTTVMTISACDDPKPTHSSFDFWHDL